MALLNSFVPNPSFVLYNSGKHTKHFQGPLCRYSTSHLRCSAVTEVTTDRRNTTHYEPTLWTYEFLQSLKNDYADVKNKDIVTKLREDVRRIIKDENEAELFTKLELIDDIQRLGLSYHFEKEIQETLHRFVSLEKSFGTTSYRSLHEAALTFRLLRQHGYDVSQDIFESFKDDKGGFKSHLTKDVKGMLSLYEVSFLGFEGEHILDEAKSFARTHLKQEVKENLSNKTQLEEVSHSLELPIHHRIPRLEARWYIEAYGKRDNANPVLLEAAQLDFNMVQSVLQRDVQEMSRWWKGTGLAAKLTFSRDRLMESFFWGSSLAFEPQFSNLRKGLTKVTSLINTIDDVYDIYGTLDELELFTSAVERWDIKTLETLPEYMKICFLALYNTVNDMVYDALIEHGIDALPYLTTAWTDLLKAFLQEAKWQHGKQLPSFDGYLKNAWVSVSGTVILVHAYFLLNHKITKEALESLQNRHHLFRLPSIIFRLRNDFGSSKAELERGEEANSLMCYMRETGTTEEYAREHIRSMIDETWKKMNKEQFIDSPFTKSFKDRAINLGRFSECTYLTGDGNSAPDKRHQNEIRSWIVEPVPLRNI
nr:isoprene synthase [Bauhinia variegata]